VQLPPESGEGPGETPTATSPATTSLYQPLSEPLPADKNECRLSIKSLRHFPRALHERILLNNRPGGGAWSCGRGRLGVGQGLCAFHNLRSKEEVCHDGALS
jgi:hypothetical protein